MQDDTYYTEIRPWGGFKILLETPTYKVKEMTVKPKARLSYQSHQHRSEHWTFVAGRATVVLDDENFDQQPGDHVNVPVGVKHRVANTGTEDVVFIEVQRGDYFGEDDIVRYSDDYNRT